MFNFIKNKLTTLYSAITSRLGTLFAQSELNNETFTELEKILLSADVGVKTTRMLVNRVKEQWKTGAIAQGNDLKKALEHELITLLQKHQFKGEQPVTLLVGINGSGKTTFAGKLAHHYKNQGKKVLLVAADTFRAAAMQQLEQWAHKASVNIVVGKENQDPASVVYQGCEQFIAGNYDKLIIDTAGRLQTKVNLMKELEKIKRIIHKHLPEIPINTLLTVDTMLGQNSFEQAKLFNESTDLSGIVLTKMDGTGKGGIILSISDTLNVPVAYISFGEQPDQFKQFEPKAFVHELLNVD